MNRRNSVIVLLALLLCSPFCYANEPVAISPYGAAIVMQRYQNCPYVMNRRQADFRYALDVVLDPAVDFDNYGFFVGTDNSLAAIGLLVNKAGYVNHIVMRTWRSTTGDTASQAIVRVLYGAGLDVNDIRGVVNSIQSYNKKYTFGTYYCASIKRTVWTKVSPMSDGDGSQWLFMASR